MALSQNCILQIYKPLNRKLIRTPHSIKAGANTHIHMHMFFVEMHEQWRMMLWPCPTTRERLNPLSRTLTKASASSLEPKLAINTILFSFNYVMWIILLSVQPCTSAAVHFLVFILFTIWLFFDLNLLKRIFFEQITHDIAVNSKHDWKLHKWEFDVENNK